VNDHQTIAILHRMKVSQGEWTEGVIPTPLVLGAALREMGRLDIAARVEEKQTVFALRD